MALTKSQEATLALDLLTVKKLPGYGSAFRISLQDGGLNPVTLFFPFEVTVTFASYPTHATPHFTSKDAVGGLVVSEVKRKMGDWSASPLRLLDIITLIQEVINSGITEEEIISQEGRYYPMLFILPSIMLRFLFGIGIVGIAAFALLSLPVAFGLLLLVVITLLFLLRPVQTVPASQCVTKTVFLPLPALPSPLPRKQKQRAFWNTP